MEVNKNNATQFLTATGVCFMIPVYQRNYDWDEDNCKQLWEDIVYIANVGGRQTHFIGTICSKTLNSHEKVIIDGQQRITTMTLLMKAMHDYVDNVEFKLDISNNYLRNTGYGISSAHRVKLHLNRRDDAIYNKLLSVDTFQEDIGLSVTERDSHIYKNYVFFYNMLKPLNEEQIYNIRMALDRIIIVDLDVESENPQEIFESLNSTGLDLTDVDLLRNYLLMSLEHETQVRLYDEYWYKIEENVGPENMVRFFVDYLIYVKKSDALQIRGRRAHINERNLYYAFRSYYETKAGKPGRYSTSLPVTEEILAHMLACSLPYKRLVFGKDVDMNKLGSLDRAIYSTIYLNDAQTSRPVLLWIMSNLRDEFIDEDQALEMLEACLSMTFRSRVTRATGISGQLAGNILQRLPEGKDSDIVSVFWKALTSGSGRFAFPGDKEFKDNLITRPIFEALRAKGTKYLLYALEQKGGSSKGLPRYDDPNTTIEHIMPKSLPEDWVEYLGSDAVNAGDHLNKLGNLALTSYNSEMSNKGFADKKTWYKDSSFHYTRKIAETDKWSIAAITKRSKDLAEKCLAIWTYPTRYQTNKESEGEAKKKRRENFQFSMIGLQPGDQIAFINNPAIVATVSDDTHVEYEGKKYSLSTLAAKLLGKKSSVAGPIYFTYDGDTLANIRDEVEGNVF